jgi:glycosyltransferase involved in cell wall biosynthesis
MQANGLLGNYVVVPNVVNTELFVPGDNSARRVPHLLHVSHLGDAHKNVSGLLRGLKKAIDQGHNVHLEIIGDGDLKPHRETAVELGLPVWAVSFSGEQPLEIIAAHMQRVDAFVLFSNYENLPCVLIEAWSSGVPTISTDVGGISEHLTSERGWLIPPGDEDQLSAAIIEVSERSFDTAALRGYALGHFSESAVCEAFTAVYQQVLS